MTDVRIVVGDCRHALQEIEAGSVQCCVTSAPRWSGGSALPSDHPDRPRDLGLVTSPYSYVAELARIFRHVRRVLATDGTVWLRIRDAYCSAELHGVRGLLGLPWRTAIAMQGDGWLLQADFHVGEEGPHLGLREHVFLFSRSDHYRCDASHLGPWLESACAAARCIRAGSRPGDAVLDIFGAPGATAYAASLWGRRAVVCDLDPARSEALRDDLGPHATLIERTW